MIGLATPDKWVRKAIYEAINNQVVDGETIPCFDQMVSADPEPERYTLMRLQNSTSAETSFCGYSWQHTISVEAFTRTRSQGNPGSRLAVNNIVDMILQATQGLTLDPASNLTIHRINFSIPGDFNERDDGYIVAAKTVLFTIQIN